MVRPAKNENRNFTNGEELADKVTIIHLDADKIKP
jgi:hypothetical protein